MSSAPQHDAPLKPALKRLPVLTEQDLLSVQKPAQYLGGELNSVVKDESQIDLRIALAFPDAYEVGMSHNGIQILYQIINDDPAAWAERVYMPLADMEQVLRSRALPLVSLEAKRPLSQFDIVGFSLQYELCLTNLLAMLELGGISQYAAERSDDEPLILGGGPFTYHPEAVAAFFDAFFLGDAEEGIADVMAVVRNFRSQLRRSRAQLLMELSKIDGIYVPSLFEPQYGTDGRLIRIEAKDLSKPVVVRRLLPSMEGAPYAARPVVPNIKTVHNRLNIEVMRGCVRGCRFCQAGYLYRPQRERSPQEIMEMIETALPATGFEELSLLSLSTADYCSIVPLLKAVMDRYGDDDRLAVSFPSTRVDALTTEVLEQVQRVRRTGFTVAPEAGTQRLRDVINKGVSDEQILETATNVFRMGWNGIKLYFMLGLPTETDEDLNGIIELARRIKELPEAKGKEITVSVSTLVPKPHTPFQWAEQISPGETIRKQRILAQGLRAIKVNFRYHGAFSTFLEGILCRADRRVAAVIARAYQLGCRFDAWDEQLEEELWLQAFTECNIDPKEYLRARDPLEPLPWDHLSCGIPKSYFLKEYQRALRDRTTPDCLTTSCSVCGACDYDVAKNVLWPRSESEALLQPSVHSKAARKTEPSSRIRLRYLKQGPYRFVGHLELVQVFHRAARRSALPLAYTLGFHPMARLSFGPPLQLGVASRAEYLELYLVSQIDPETVRGFLNDSLPPELQCVTAESIPLHAPSLQQAITEQAYAVEWLSEPRGPLSAFSSTTELLIPRLLDLTVERIRPGRKRRKTTTLTLKDHLSKVSLVDNGLCFTLRCDGSRAVPRATEIVEVISELKIGDYSMEKVACCLGAERPPSGRLLLQLAV